MPVVKNNGSFLVENKNFTADYVEKNVIKVVLDDEKLRKTSYNMLGFCPLDAVERICDEVEKEGLKK